MHVTCIFVNLFVFCGGAIFFKRFIKCLLFSILQGVTVMTNNTFGVSIDELLRRSEGCEVPPIIKNIVEYLAKHGQC